MNAAAGGVPTGAAALPPRQLRLVISGVVIGMAVAALDGTVVNTALTTMVGDLGGLDGYAWIGTAYLLTSTTSTPLWGKLADLYGRRLLFQLTIGLFGVASLLCGISQTTSQLVAARALQGVGGGGLFAIGFIIIGDVVAPRERGRYTGFITSVFTASSVVGPFIGGFFVDHLSWRWLFTLNVPIGIAAMIVIERGMRSIGFQRVEHRIDWAGAVTLVGAVVSLILALQWTSHAYGWTHPATLGLVGAAVVLAVVFVGVERRAAEPMLPLRLFAVPTVRAVLPMMWCAGGVFFGATAFMPLYLQAVLGVDPTMAGVLTLPMALAVAVSANWIGQRVARTGRYHRWPAYGVGCFAFGALIWSTMTVERSWLPIGMVGMVAFGIGVGMTMPIATTAVQNAVEWRDLGVASSAVLFFRSLGGVVLLAAFGAVLNGTVAGGVDPEFVQRPREIRSLPPIERAAALDAMTTGLGRIFLLAIPFALVGAVLAWRIPPLPLRETIAPSTPADGSNAPAG